MSKGSIGLRLLHIETYDIKFFSCLDFLEFARSVSCEKFDIKRVREILGMPAVYFFCWLRTWNLRPHPLLKYSNWQTRSSISTRSRQDDHFQRFDCFYRMVIIQPNHKRRLTFTDRTCTLVNQVEYHKRKASKQHSCGPGKWRQKGKRGIKIQVWKQPSPKTFKWDHHFLSSQTSKNFYFDSY